MIERVVGVDASDAAPARYGGAPARHAWVADVPGQREIEGMGAWEVASGMRRSEPPAQGVRGRASGLCGGSFVCSLSVLCVAPPVRPAGLVSYLILSYQWHV